MTSDASARRSSPARPRPRPRPGRSGAARRRWPGSTRELQAPVAAPPGRRRASACGPPWRCSRPRPRGADEAIGVPGAVAIELVHNFSLIHDDIIDGDRERRHRPTVWAEFGVGPAIIAGDALATLAIEVLLESRTRPAARRRPSRWPQATQADDRRAGRRHGVRAAAARDASRSASTWRSARPAPCSRARPPSGRSWPAPPDATVEALSRLRAPPRDGLPGRRRPARHLGRPGGHRQAGRERPPPAQEDAARSSIALAAADGLAGEFVALLRRPALRARGGDAAARSSRPRGPRGDHGAGRGAPRRGPGAPSTRCRLLAGAGRRAGGHRACS